MTKITKKDLTDALADKTGLTRKQAAEAVDALGAIIAENLADGNAVPFAGGTFKPVQRAARTGFNPAKQEALQIPARKTAIFTPGAALKASLN